jgi:hypothetical protein
MHYAHMAPLQLVLRGPERSSSRLDLVSNADNRAPSTFEDIDHDVRVPRLGGPQLLAVAESAVKEGFWVNRFELAGPDLKLIRDEALEEELSAELLQALTDHGSAAAYALLRHELRGYTIAGVRLQKAGSKVITVRRNGVVIADRPDGLLDFFVSIWKKVTGW